MIIIIHSAFKLPGKVKRSGIQHVMQRIESLYECRYAQAGTPHVKLQQTYDSSKQSLTISATQETTPTAGQEKKGPVLIPVRVALFAKSGKQLPICLKVEQFRQLIYTTKLLQHFRQSTNIVRNSPHRNAFQGLQKVLQGLETTQNADT